MRRIAVSALVFLCAAALLAGCAGNAAASEEEAPDDFAISFSFWINPNQPNIYDTYQKIIQKDLVTDGTASADLTVTGTTLNDIYRKIKALELDEITEAMVSANLTTSDLQVNITPCTEYKVTFTVRGAEYTVTGDDTAWHYKDGNSSAGRFCLFVEFMKDICRNSEEYMALPDAKGLYQ